MNTSVRSIAVLGFAFWSVSAFAGGVHVVAEFPGPGIDHLSIADAIAAATDGDIIVVKQGAYDGFTVDDKELTITAELGSNPTIDGAMRLQFLAPDKRLVLRGFTTSNGAPNQPGMIVDTCHGIVWLENMTIKGGPPAGGATGATGMHVKDSPGIVLLRSSIRGGGPKSTGAFPDAGTALVVDASSVAAYETNFLGLSGTYHDDRGGDGGDGVRVLSGSFEGFWCTLRGGNGGASDDDWDGFCGCVDCPIPGSGGDGIEVAFGHVGKLTSCSLFAGAAGPFTGFEPSCFDGAPGALANGTVIETTLTERAFSATSPVRETNSLTLKIEGVPNEMTLLLLGTQPSLTPAPQFAGNLLTPPVFVAAIGPLPPTGALTLTPTFGILPPGVEGVVIYLQVAFATNGGVLGPASQVTLLDISS